MKTATATLVALCLAGCAENNPTNKQVAHVDYVPMLMPLVDGATAEEVRAAVANQNGRYFTGHLRFNISSHPVWDEIVLSVDTESGNVVPGQVMFYSKKLKGKMVKRVVSALQKDSPLYRPAAETVIDKVAQKVKYEFGEGNSKKVVDFSGRLRQWSGSIATLKPAKGLAPGTLSICSLSSGEPCVEAVRVALTTKGAL